MNDKVRIKVFITKNGKFRARIKELDKPTYEVSVGSDSWLEGKGVKYHSVIRRKCNLLMVELRGQINEFLNPSPTKLLSKNP